MEKKSRTHSLTHPAYLMLGKPKLSLRNKDVEWSSIKYMSLYLIIPIKLYTMTRYSCAIKIYTMSWHVYQICTVITPIDKATHSVEVLYMLDC